MDILTVLDDFRKRISHLENDSVEIHDRMGRVEDKCSGAWKTIAETKDDFRQFKDEVKKDMNALRDDIKELKAKERQKSILLVILLIVSGFSLLVSIVFFISIWKNDRQTAEALLALGGTAGKAAVGLLL